MFPDVDTSVITMSPPPDPSNPFATISCENPSTFKFSIVVVPYGLPVSGSIATVIKE